MGGKLAAANAEVALAVDRDNLSFGVFHQAAAGGAVGQAQGVRLICATLASRTMACCGLRAFFLQRKYEITLALPGISPRPITPIRCISRWWSRCQSRSAQECASRRPACGRRGNPAGARRGSDAEAGSRQPWATPRRAGREFLNRKRPTKHVRRPRCLAGVAGVSLPPLTWFSYVCLLSSHWGNFSSDFLLPFSVVELPRTIIQGCIRIFLGMSGHRVFRRV